MATRKLKKTASDYNDDLGLRIRMFRMQKGLMQGQLGRKIGVSANGVTNWEAGIGHPTAKKIKVLCDALDITPDQLFGFPSRGSHLTDDEHQLLQVYRNLTPEDKAVGLAMLHTFAEKRSIQQANREKDWYFEHYLRISKNSLKVSAGTGEPLWDHRGLSYVYLKRNDLTEAADEVITVHGDSMEPKFHDGDDLLVKHTSSVEYGEIGIFVADGEGLVKEYRPEGLYSINSDKYPLIPAESLQTCLCVGKVTGVITPNMRAEQDDIDILKKIYATKRKDK